MIDPLIFQFMRQVGREPSAAGDWRDVAGPQMCLALVPVAHLVGRLPIGNTGGASVSAFEPMAIPPDLQPLLEDRDR